ncbi:Alpha/Beta hydrolase protein, partial [Amylocystis lapponica]
LQYILAYFLWSQDVVEPQPRRFELRHEHGLSPSSRVVFSDIASSANLAQPEFSVKSSQLSVYRPSSPSAFSSARFRGANGNAGPDVRDRESLLQLAKMTNNAYAVPGDKDWYDLGPDWNNSYPFGWEPDADGFRGHIFATPDNSTVIISVKGTSAGWMVGGGGPTPKKDKLNDNLLFSCCCARVGPTWSTVCGCYEGSYKCDQNCLEKIGMNLYNNVTYMYPDSDIWIVGHSLGGALASLMGATFGVPVVAFEAPGDKLAATRLHLPSPPSTHHITHVYHTADPIAMGTCNGVTSYCAAGGYALETRCHLGNVIKYDTVSTLGWAVDLHTHGIKVVIEKLLSASWNSTDNSGHVVPELSEEEDCTDCFNWEFGDFRNASAATATCGEHTP